MMVQQAAPGSFSEINEFQVVHALITHSQKGTEDATCKSSCDSNANDNDSTFSCSNMLTLMCQQYNSSLCNNSRRNLSKFVKESDQQQTSKQYSVLNKPPDDQRSQDRCNSASSTSRVFANAEKKLLASQARASVVRSVAILKAPSDVEKLVPNSPMTISSNVQDKVQQFEKQANLLRGDASAPSNPSFHNPLPSLLSLNKNSGLACPSNLKPSNSSCKHPSQLCPRVQSKSIEHKAGDFMVNLPKNSPPLRKAAGRSLKRVPSERFQKMRRKVQKLMFPKRESNDFTSPVLPTSMDEDTYLRSIRIPEPGFLHWKPGHQAMILRMPDHVLCNVFSYLDTRTLAAVKRTCSDFNFLINHFDVRASDSKWTKDDRYLADPCKQCRHVFVRGDMSMCRFHPKRYYSDLPYGRSYWMCCLQSNKNAPGCKTGLHDNDWRINL